METKRELNDILINDDDLQKQNRTKKLMMMIAMALIFLCILIAVVFVITRDEEELSERERANNNGLTPIESQNSFVNVPINNAPEEVDPFQQILDDIRSREQQANTQVAQNTQPTTPSVPKEPTKPAQQPASTSKVTTPSKPATQPVLPPKPAQNTQPTTPSVPKEPTKPAQQPASTSKVTTPSKPATQPAQTSNIANIFEDVSTPRMDTSKNGQVAEKGFYVQVGSFANKPSAEFLKQINNYSYRVYAGTSNGQPTTKYLIGPYNSRTEASRDLPNFKTIVPNPVHFEVK
ncbi:SPOR domain-containing protein [Helicobacter marmotae]|uniref:SPOR domain-containing protein n=1 Tax=Helicobacter marmotae TaxID=152490 RepID=UPI000CF061D9|nr:SPOR domain-containing protein [Helicobacter marmotae]